MRQLLKPSGSTGALALTVLAVLALPGTAIAAGGASLTADYNTGELLYRAGAGQVNVLRVAQDDGEMKVRDDALSAITLIQAGGSGCRQSTPSRFRCPEFKRLSVDLGDGADTADLSAVAAPATVIARDGAKTIETGAGDDRIFAHNGSVDSVRCGDGNDSVVADPGDVVSGDCEVVTTTDASPAAGVAPVAPAGGGDPAGAGPSPLPGAYGGSPQDAAQPPIFDTPIGVVLPDAPVTVPDAGTAIVHVGCADAAVASCHGDISIRARVLVRADGPQGGGARAARGHYVVQQRNIGHRRFTVGRGKEKALPMQIHLRGHYTLATRRRRGRARLRVVQRDAAGKVMSVTSRSVTLVVQKHRWSRRQLG